MTWSTAKMVMLGIGIALACVSYAEAKADPSYSVTVQDSGATERN